MNQLAVGVTALILVMGNPSFVGAQIFPGNVDICQVAWFHDKAQSAEYSTLYSKIKDSGRHSQALREAFPLHTAFMRRLTPDVHAMVMKATNAVSGNIAQDPALADEQAILAERCLTRIRQNPEKETELLLDAIRTKRELLALSDAELNRRTLAEANSLIKSFDTPYHFEQTLRTALGLQAQN